MKGVLSNPKHVRKWDKQSLHKVRAKAMRPWSNKLVDCYHSHWRLSFCASAQVWGWTWGCPGSTGLNPCGVQVEKPGSSSENTSIIPYSSNTNLGVVVTPKKLQPRF